MRKKNLAALIFGILSVSGCTLDSVIDAGDICPPVMGEDDLNRVSGELLYIDTMACTKDNCGKFEQYFKIRKCPPEFKHCVQTDDGNNYYCVGEKKCANGHFLCTTAEDAQGKCVDPNSLKTCGASKEHCEDGAPYGGEDCSKLGAAKCDESSRACVLLENAMKCGDMYIEPSASETCGSSCDNGVPNKGKNCIEDYEEPRVCLTVGDKQRCMCGNNQLTVEDVNETKCFETKEQYNCGEERACKLVKDNLIRCLVDDKENCGSTCEDCRSLHDNAVCEEGVCVIRACNDGEHPEYLSKDDPAYMEGVVDRCVKNTPEACGAPDMPEDGLKNCTDYLSEHANATGMECLPDGECRVSSCEEGYHVSLAGECEVDSVTSCGEHGEINCNDMMGDRVQEVACEQSICVVLTCEEGFHLNATRDACEANADDKCAAQNSNEVLNCANLVQANAEQMSCIAGKCGVLKCATGYHIGADLMTCEPDTETACGRVDSAEVVDCSQNLPANVTGRACQQGICVATTCASGYHVSDDGLGCVDNSATTCGPSKTDCTQNMPANAISRICESDTCKVSACADNYHLSADRLSCVANSDAACGATNSSAPVNCSTGLPANATARVCDAGVCKVSVCATNYHLSADRLSCVANSTAACGATNSTSTTNCSSGLPANATTRVCDAGVCKVSNCAANYHLSSDRLSCVANSASACAATNSSSTTNCSQNLPANSSTRVCEGGVCKISVCATNYHLSSDKLSCVANSTSACGATNSSSTTNCSQNLPSNAAKRVCESGSCKVTKCNDGYHVKEARTGCAKNSASACGGTTWDGTGSYSKYVKACSSPTSSCVSGACNCSGYPDKVLNYEKNACVPSVCQGIPGIKKGSVQTQNFYNTNLSENACHADECQSGYTMKTQGKAAMCRPSASKFNCSDMGYKYSSGGYCRGCTSDGTCGHNHCKSGYRYFQMACLKPDYCCGTRNVSMTGDLDYACRNCASEGKVCDTSTGKCKKK